MIKLSVLYPNIEEGTFNFDYYCNNHIPMVRKKLGNTCKHINVEQGICGHKIGTKAIYIAMGHLYFESIESFQTIFALHGKVIMEDRPNYTDIHPLVQISDVKIIE